MFFFGQFLLSESQKNGKYFSLFCRVGYFIWKIKCGFLRNQQDHNLIKIANDMQLSQKSDAIPAMLAK